MKKLRKLPGLLALTALLSAHPMGNFSVNHYARIEFTPEGANLLFVLDLAEIPTFELMQKWGAAPGAAASDMQRQAVAQAREWSHQLHVSVNGKSVAPIFEGANLTLTDGAGGLPVAHIRTRLKVPAAGGTLRYEDGTYPDRTAGWKEVVVTAKGGAAIEKTTQGSQDRSAGLTAYPQDATVAPPQDLTASVSWTGEPGSKRIVTQVTPAPAPVPVPAFTPPPAAKPAPVAATAPTVAEPNAMGAVTRGDFLSRALQGREIGWGLGLICIAVAFWFGALHALEPGHGKTMVAAYLVGSRGTPKHAILLGSIVTFTHTVSVFFLGLVTLFLSRYIMADLLSKILGILSGLTIVWIGAMLLFARVKSLRRAAARSRTAARRNEYAEEHVHVHASGGPPHSHGRGVTHSHGGSTHTHGGHARSHVPEGEVSLKNLIVLGASGGLVPCPSALVLLLSAISIGRAGFGLLLLVSFSLGLALVLMATGLLVLYARNLFPERAGGASNPFFRVMPVISAAVILLIGIVLTGNAAGVIPVVRFFG